MQTAASLISTCSLDGQGGGLVVGDRPFGIETVSYGAEGYKAEGETQSAMQSQSCIYKVQAAVLDVQSVISLLHSSGRQTHTHIQDKAE